MHLLSKFLLLLTTLAICSCCPIFSFIKDCEKCKTGCDRIIEINTAGTLMPEDHLENYLQVCSCPPIYIYEDKEMENGYLYSAIAGNTGGNKSGEEVNLSLDQDEINASEKVLGFIKERGKLNITSLNDIAELDVAVLASKYSLQPIDNAINIAILDTEIGYLQLFNALENRAADMHFKFHLANKRQCSTNGNGNDLNHGTAVAYQLIDKLIKNGNEKDVNIFAYSITNKQNKVTLSKVRCAINSAIEDENNYYNMSFGFDKCNTLLRDNLNTLISYPEVKKIVVALGNDSNFLNIDPACTGSVDSSFPSQFNFNKIIKVGAIHGGQLWENSNYVNDQIYVASPFINNIDTVGGGTSYAAPRILADIICEPFSSSQFTSRTIPLHNNNQIQVDVLQEF